MPMRSPRQIFFGITVRQQDCVATSRKIVVDWTFCENILRPEIIQGPNATVAHLLYGYNYNRQVRMGGVQQQEQNLGSESGRENLTFFELSISNLYTFYIRSEIQTS
jgi:hypothetical protein